MYELTLGLFSLAGDPTELAFLGRSDTLAARVERLDRLFPGFDRFRETDLVVFREQRVLPDVGQVQANEVFIVTVDTIFGHVLAPLGPVVERFAMTAMLWSLSGRWPVLTTGCHSRSPCD